MPTEVRVGEAPEVPLAPEARPLGEDRERQDLAVRKPPRPTTLPTEYLPPASRVPSGSTPRSRLLVMAPALLTCAPQVGQACALLDSREKHLGHCCIPYCRRNITCSRRAMVEARCLGAGQQNQCRIERLYAQRRVLALPSRDGTATGWASLNGARMARLEHRSNMPP